MQPLFITIEGGEGAGKSSQIRLLSEHLTGCGIAHITTREPGGSTGAEAIRQLIVTGEAGRWDAISETLLIMAARASHLQESIYPALKAGKWVLCDRFMDSTYVYQGVVKGLGEAWLRQLYTLIAGNLSPNLTFLLDIDPEVGLSRAHARHSAENRFESLPLSFHQQVRQGFLQLAANEPERIRIIDASMGIDAIQQAMRAQLLTLGARA